MGLQIFILQFDLHCPVGWANPWLFTWQRLPRHLRLPWHGGRLPAKMIFFLCPGGFQREGPSLGGSLVDRVSGHCGAPSSLLLPAHLLSGGFLKILFSFSSLTMFSFQRLPKTDSDASKENKETEVGSSFHKIDFHKMPFQRSSRERVLKTRETRSSPPSSASSATSCSWPTLARPSSSSLLSWDSAHSCQSTF